MWKGIGVSAGIAIGCAILVRKPDLDYSSVVPSDTLSEQYRLSHATQDYINKIRTQACRLEEQVGKQQAQILLAQIEMLQDPYLSRQMDDLIGQGHCAEFAVDTACQTYIDQFSALEDAFMRQRACDLRDMRSGLLAQLLGETGPDLAHLPPDAVLVAKELTPSMMSLLDREHLQGIVTEAGGSTSHCAILARALGLPAVFSVPEVTNFIQNGDILLLDGKSGIVHLSPDEDTLAQYRNRQQLWQEEQTDLLAYTNAATVTAQGRKVALYGNIGSPQEGKQVAALSGDGIGLFRTEFLFMDRTTPPSEEEQFLAYRQVLEEMEGREVIIRTLDVGGDKNIPYLALSKEDNPFLGVRGVRYCLAQPEVFLPQLRALVRASVYGNLSIMLPMVSTVEEVFQTKELLAQIRREFNQTSVPYRQNIKLGIMVETPAALLMADSLAREVDFFSIGTNDLTQYIMAADRGNQGVQSLSSPYHPAVLRAICHIIRTGHQAGIPVGMCGEAAADPALVPILLAFGLEEFSVSPSSILSIRKAISQWNEENSNHLVTSVLQCTTAREIHDLLS